MLTIAFTKAEGSQNDFVLVDDRDSPIPVEYRRSFARAACHRRRGIGADGVVFITPSQTHDFIMSFYNPDGSDGSMCGNGGRCAALYAFRHGIAESTMRFEAVGKEYRALVNDEIVRLYFPEPTEIRLEGSVLVDGSPVPCRFADTGAPHAVIFAEDLGITSVADFLKFDVATFGREVREAETFQPRGANANFLFEENDTVHIRTFEKGVEAETEACGTGTIAGALITALIKGIQPPISILTRNNDLLTVGFTPPDDYHAEAFRRASSAATSIFADDLYFEGRAHLAFSGTAVFDETTGELNSR